MSDAIVSVTEKVSPSVVRVSAGRRSFGTGVVWSEDGHIVTNHHVVGQARSVEIGLEDGKSLTAEVIGTDPFSDIALLKLETKGLDSKLKPIEIGESDSLRVGQFVLAVANPFGEHPAVVSGIITSSRKDVDGWFGRVMENMIVSDAPVNPGYSGGPLVDAQGKMIGMNTAYVNTRALSIPVDTIKLAVERLKRDGRIKTGYLGVILDAIRLPEEVSSEVGQDYGLIILSVSRRTPAREAGLSIGDVLLRFNGKPINNHFELRRLLSEDVVGKTVKMSVLRGERLVELSVTPMDEDTIDE